MATEGESLCSFVAIEEKTAHMSAATTVLDDDTKSLSEVRPFAVRSIHAI